MKSKSTLAAIIAMSMSVAEGTQLAKQAFLSRGSNSPGSARHGAGMASIRAARKERNVRRHRKMVKG